MKRSRKRTEPRILNYAWKAAVLITPLIGLLPARCNAPQKTQYSECASHNETTISLNAEANGVVAGVEELEKPPREGILQPSIIDLINETHPLSSEGMPTDVSLTEIPQSCFKDALAYAVVGGGDLGAYVPTVLGLYDVEIIYHEVGHFQYMGAHNSNEVISTLNSIEQMPIAFGLLAEQSDTFAPFTGFYPYSPRARDTMKWFLDYIRISRNMTDNTSFVSPIFTQEYTMETLFLTLRLIELDGDFSALRNEVRQLLNDGTMDTTMKKAVVDAIKKYSATDLYASNADAEGDLMFMMVFFKQLYEIFGLDTAMRLFDSDRYLATGFVIGIDDMDCRMTSVFASSYSELDNADHELYEKINADQVVKIKEGTLCCVDIDPILDNKDDPKFRKWNVKVEGFQYSSSSGSVSLDDKEFEYIIKVTPTASVQIGLDEICQ